jgi:MFS family permease
MTTKAPPQKQTTEKISGKLWFSLISLGFVGSLAWAVENQFFNTFLYNKITPNPQPIAWMVAASAITATLASILIGTLGDRLRYKYGRKPILLFGYIAWGITTAAFPLAALLQPISLAIAIAILFDCLMTFFGSGANDANFNAFATDVTTINNRGKVLGVLQILTWVSMLFVYGASGLIIEAFNYEVYFFIIGALVFVLGIAGALLIKEEKPAGPPSGTYWSQIADTFQWKKLAKQRDLLLVLLGIMLWGIAQQIWFPYLMIYLSHYLKLSTLESTVLVAVAIGLGGIGMAYPFGLLVDKWGRKQVAILAVFLEVIGLLAFSFARSSPALIIGGILFLAPISAWTIATSTWSKDLFPAEKRGQFAGYVILFSVAFTMIPGPLLGSWLSTAYGIQTVIDGQQGYIPTPIIFQAGAIATLAAAIPLFRARSSDKLLKIKPDGRQYKT